MIKKKAIKVVFLVIFIILFLIAVLAYLAIYGIFTFQGLNAVNAKLLSYNLSFNFSALRHLYPQYKYYSIAAPVVLLLASVMICLSLKKKDDEQKPSEEQNRLKRDIVESHSRANTELDALYEALKKEKSIKISAIMNAFNISQDLALEWAKILESGGLASLNYPRMSEPEIIINENKENKEDGEEH